MTDQLPLNFNFHLLNAISFNKGCYIGQELTQRTYHTGVIRKSIMTFIIIDQLKMNVVDEYSELNFVIPVRSVKKEFDQNLAGLIVQNKEGEEVGKIISNYHNVGLALVDRQKIEETKVSQFLINGMNTIIYDPTSMWDLLKKICEGTASENDVLGDLFDKDGKIKPEHFEPLDKPKS